MADRMEDQVDDDVSETSWVRIEADPSCRMTLQGDAFVRGLRFERAYGRTGDFFEIDVAKIEFERSRLGAGLVEKLRDQHRQPVDLCQRLR